MTAVLTKPPKTGRPVHIRHSKIEGNSVKAGKVVGKLQALGKALGGGDAHLWVASAEMACREITAETVFIGQKKAHGIAPLPGSSAVDR